MRSARPIVAQRGAPDFVLLQNLLALAFLCEQERRRSAEKQLSDAAEGFKSTLVALRRVLEPEVAMLDVLPSLVDQISALSNASGAAIALAEGDAIACAAASGPLSPPPGTPVVREKGISGECLQTGRSIYCNDTEADPRVDAAACRDAGMRSVMAVPICTASGAVGLIELFGTQPNAFGQREKDILEVIAAILAQRIQTQQGHTPATWLPDSAVEPQSVGAIEAAARTTAAISPEAPQASVPEPAPDLIVVRHEPPATAAHQWIWGLMVSVIIAAAVWAGMHFFAGRKPVTPVPAAPSAPLAEPSAPLAEPEPQPPVTEAAPITATVEAVKYSSKPQFTSVAVELTGPVSVRTARLHNPERVYFDVAGTLLPAAIPSKIEVGDEFVARIRIRQKTRGTTRIVMDLKCVCDSAYVLSASAPYRLVINIQPPGDVSHDTDKPADKPDTSTMHHPVAPPNPETALGRRWKIVIDPGHGGDDLGAVGRGGLKEKDLVLEVAQRLGTLLSRRLGADIIYTRTDDRFVSLEARSAIANESRGDLLISIHGNSSPDGVARGVETYYYDPGPDKTRLHQAALRPRTSESRQLAARIQSALVVSAKGRKRPNRGIKEAGFAVLAGVDMPAALTEIGFLTTPQDEQAVMQPATRERIAEGIAQGLASYFKHAKASPATRS